MKSWVLVCLMMVRLGFGVQQVAPWTEVELELDGANMPFINGDIRMMVDTSLSVPIGVKKCGSGTGSLIEVKSSSKGLFEAAEVLVPSVHLDTWTFYNVRGFRLEETSSYEAVVGLPLFEGLNLLIDYPQRRVAVAAKAHFFRWMGYRPEKWLTLPMKEGRVVEVEFNKEVVRALLDTSCPSVLVRFECHFGEISLGEQYLGQYQVETAQLPEGVDIILGAPFFLRRPVIFDFVNNCLLFGKELVE